jgi:hypothetical protein
MTASAVIEQGIGPENNTFLTSFCLKYFENRIAARLSAVSVMKYPVPDAV